MAGCEGGCAQGCGDGGPFAEGRELVEFVARAHGGSLVRKAIPNGGLETFCQGCGAPFVLTTFVGTCPICGGVHAVSPPRATSADNIQYAGEAFSLIL